MPIIVVTADYCYDGRKHAKIPLNGAEDLNDRPESPVPLKPKERLRGIDIRRESYNITEDMKDVYALKVIHITEPSTINSNETTTTVIGENIYFERDEKAMLELNDAISGNSRKKDKEVEVSEPTLLQRVRQYRCTNEKLHKKHDLIQQIKLSNNRIQFVKAGGAIKLEEYSLEECLEWSFRYIKSHEDRLPYEVFDMLDEIERFQECKDLNFVALSASKNSNLKPAKTDKHHNKVSNAVTPTTIAQQLDKACADGLETFAQSQFITRKFSKARLVEQEIITSRKSGGLDAINEESSCASTSLSSSGKPSPAPPITSRPSHANRRASSRNITAVGTYNGDQTARVPTIDEDEEDNGMRAQRVPPAAVHEAAASTSVPKAKNPRESRATQEARVRAKLLKAREKEFERILSTAHRHFDASQVKFGLLQTSAQSKLQNLTGNATELFETWASFDKKIKDNEEILSQMCYEKEFMFRRNIKVKLTNAPLGDRLTDTSNNSFQKELRKMNKLAMAEQHQEYMQRISSILWYIMAISKLRDLQKRSASPIPSCCFQFLIVLKYLFMFGFKFDSEELFYFVMNNTVTSPEDHAKLVVHRLLKSAREIVGVGAEKFLKYLEEKSIQPCVALLAQVRAIQQRRVHKAKELQKQREAALAAQLDTSTVPSGSVDLSASVLTSSVQLGDTCSGSLHSVEFDLDNSAEIGDDDDGDDEDDDFD